MLSEKKRSKHNAIKHGVFAKILLKDEEFGEERQDYLNLISAVRFSIQPNSSLEEILVDQLAFHFLRLTRVYKADFQIAPRVFERVSELAEYEPPFDSEDPEYQILRVRRVPTSELMVRYETSIERQIGRTLDQIETVRKMRRSNDESEERN